MASTNGDGVPRLDGDQRLLPDAMTAQMQRIMREDENELYDWIEGIETRVLSETTDDSCLKVIFQYKDEWSDEVPICYPSNLQCI